MTVNRIRRNYIPRSNNFQNGQTPMSTSGIPSSPWTEANPNHVDELLSQEQDCSRWAPVAWTEFTASLESGVPSAIARSAYQLAGAVREYSARCSFLAYRIAIWQVDPEYSPAATTDLAHMVDLTGHREYARELYELAVASNHPVHANKAAVDYGLFLQENGETDRAIEMFNAAMTSGHSEYGPSAALSLAWLLEEKGDSQAAAAAYTFAIEAHHDEFSAVAGVQLGDMHRGRGEFQAAYDAYWSVVESGHPEWSPRAALGAGQILQNHDYDLALQALQIAVDSTDQDVALQALFLQADIFECKEDQEAARDAYRRVRDSGHPELAEQAEEALTRYAEQDTEIAELTEKHRQAESEHDAAKAAELAIELGGLFEECNRWTEAGPWYRAAMDSGDPDRGPEGAFLLGDLLRPGSSRPRTPAQRKPSSHAYQFVIDSGHSDYAPDALISLGQVNLQIGARPDAQRAFLRAVESGHSECAPRAALCLGDMLLEDGDRPGAEAAFRRAAQSEHDGIVRRAAQRAAPGVSVGVSGPRSNAEGGQHLRHDP